MAHTDMNDTSYWPQFDSYVKHSLRNAQINYYHQQLRDQRVIADDDLVLMACLDSDEVDDYPSDHYRLYVNGVAYQMDDEELYKALQRLPDKLLQVLVLRFWHDNSETEIAQKLNMTVRSCYGRRKKALSILRELLEGDDMGGELNEKADE